jgi:hypothetical protein
VSARIVSPQAAVLRLGGGDLAGFHQHLEALELAPALMPGSAWKSLAIQRPSSPAGGT